MQKATDWKRIVYRQRQKQKVKFTSKHWLMLRRKTFKRDSFICQRCKIMFSENGLMLQAHHVKPRSEGGKTKLSNLITLCNPCHDIVEVEGFDFGFNIPKEDLKISEATNDWHKWVYGGYDKPF